MLFGCCGAMRITDRPRSNRGHCCLARILSGRSARGQCFYPEYLSSEALYEGQPATVLNQRQADLTQRWRGEQPAPVGGVEISKLPERAFHTEGFAHNGRPFTTGRPPAAVGFACRQGIGRPLPVEFAAMSVWSEDAVVHVNLATTRKANDILRIVRSLTGIHGNHLRYPSPASMEDRRARTAAIPSTHPGPECRHRPKPLLSRNTRPLTSWNGSKALHSRAHAHVGMPTKQGSPLGLPC